jgi:hypothetical protein
MNLIWLIHKLEKAPRNQLCDELRKKCEAFDGKSEKAARKLLEEIFNAPITERSVFIASITDPRYTKDYKLV